ncbi:SHOCT domain-containing protein [Rhodococcus sp. HM1]|uniref:SHOCT domain-containing protein n=1 Tax=unclassified Rhodococcus (in: high G+C Gram-positive bacteria) TaxID=192944 RepID=UPI0018CD499B|nr:MULTISPECIES: SHOCT domain-containing protein [unclassified Rhodococcus (in: high G+C Gram-positive bacteria)]MBH0119720.1 SHOCT domain-containing protein [Rhodococcus sp. CX]MCK8674736.1 SHOCT domain-containing protein [Rhodococcus sp. HM1]
MPGLLRGVARTAVIAGTATSVSNRVSRRQGQRWARQEQEEYARAQQQQAAPPPPPPPQSSGGVDRLEALKQLGELKAQGVLTEAEFEAEKARILAG